MIDWVGMRHAVNEGLYASIRYGMEWGVKVTVLVAVVTAGIVTVIRQIR